VYLFLVFYVPLISSEFLYTLLTNEGAPNSVISIDLSDGSFTTVVDLSPIQSNFPNLLQTTAYDANSDNFLLGNGLPPLLGVVNTFSKQSIIAKLPEYGTLLSFTIYDGFAYTIIGSDVDIPYLGHLVEYNLKTGDMDRISKIHISPSLSFVINSPLIFIPNKNTWFFEIQDSNVYKLTVYSNSSTVVETTIPGGWSSFWYDVDYNNHTMLAYAKGMAVWIDFINETVQLFDKFPCYDSGVFSVDFVYQLAYHYSDCTNKPTVQTLTLKNDTQRVTTLDPALNSVMSLQSRTQYTPYLCGATCTIHPDCENSKTCGTCRLGRCVSPGSCGDYCQTPTDCYGGICVKDCEQNRCGRRGCASACTNNDDCKKVSTQCQVCRLGFCVDYGDCGSYCLTPTDCYAGLCTTNCVNFYCTQKN